MGKKYVIELPENTHWIQWIMESTKTKDHHPYMDYKQIEDLTLYTEPDLEQVRKEAYDKCMDEAEMLAYKLYSPKIDGAYQRGLNDAWEAARKIAHGFLWGSYQREAGRSSACAQAVLDHYSASEAVKKIWKEEEITKGDVVRMKSAPEIEILVTFADETYFSGIAMTEVDDNCEIGDQYTDIVIHKVEKTGRHYEIAEVLRKMREG